MITNTKIVIVTKSLVVFGALLLGFLMPYISRIPYSFKFGFSWIWSYMNDSDAAYWWNVMHLQSLVPIVVFGLLFIFGNLRWGFYGSAVAHFAATIFFYYDHGAVPHSDDFLGFIVFPYLIGIPSFVCGVIGLIAELIVSGRRGKQINEPKFK